VAASLRASRRRALLPALLLLGLTLAMTGALELAVRLSGYSDRYVYDPVYRPSEDPEAIAYLHRPFLRDALGHSRTRFSTDALGLRTSEPERPLRPKPAHEYRIAVLGDSITFGQGVATPQTFCSVLETELSKRVPGHSFRVLNFGVAGYSVKEMHGTLCRRVPQAEPDLVLFAIIFSDFELERCGRVDCWGYVHNRKLRSYDDPDAIHYLLLRQLHLTYLVRDVALRLGLARRSGTRWPAAVPGELPESFSHVAAAAEEAHRHGTAFSVVLLPSVQHDGSELDAVRLRLVQDGIGVLDFSRLRTEFRLEEYRASRHDPHPGPVVHERIGRGLAKEIARRLAPPAVADSTAAAPLSR
jgi:hypothetical protein